MLGSIEKASTKNELVDRNSRARAAALADTVFDGTNIQLEWSDSDSDFRVFSSTGDYLGRVVETMPLCKTIVGFSGPTNVILVLDHAERIRLMQIVESRDTRDHVKLIESQPSYFDWWRGKNIGEAARSRSPNVAGATLTSVAIRQSIQLRFGVEAREGKFMEPVSLDDAQTVFRDVIGLQRDEAFDGLFRVLDASENQIGWILRTSPTADDIVGYQGPTDSIIGFDSSGKIVGMKILSSYDNEPYTSYLRRDSYFAALWKKFDFKSLAAADVDELSIEGVSGATMSSSAVVESILKTASMYRASIEADEQTKHDRIIVAMKASMTASILLLAIWISYAHVAIKKRLRLAFLLVVIAYLGFYQADILSLAMLVGWARNGIPWTTAIGLVLITVVAFILPAIFKRNVYCSNVCPHGAVQQLLPRRWQSRKRIPHRALVALSYLKPILWGWVLFVLVVWPSFSLVDLEPFDAYAWRAAGLPSVAIAIVGLGFSLFVPMGYCQYGCLTGSLLQYVRRHPKSHRWHKADWLAVAFLVGAAIALWRG